MNNLKQIIIKNLKKNHKDCYEKSLLEAKKEYEKFQSQYEKQAYKGKNPLKVLWQDVKNSGNSLKSKFRFSTFLLVFSTPVIFNATAFIFSNHSTISNDLHYKIVNLFLLFLISVPGTFLSYMLYSIFFENGEFSLRRKTELTIDYENKKQKYERMFSFYQQSLQDIENMFVDKERYNNVLNSEMLNKIIDSETCHYISQNLSEEDLKTILLDSFYDGDQNIYYSSIVDYIKRKQSENNATFLANKMKKNKINVKEKEVVLV